MRYVLMFGTSSDTPDAEDYELQAKQMTDDKTILHQKKVKELIDTLSVKKNSDKPAYFNFQTEIAVNREKQNN